LRQKRAELPYHQQTGEMQPESTEDNVSKRNITMQTHRLAAFGCGGFQPPVCARSREIASRGVSSDEVIQSKGQ
jgi:hypothetical protein